MNSSEMPDFKVVVTWKVKREGQESETTSKEEYSSEEYNEAFDRFRDTMLDPSEIPLKDTQKGDKAFKVELIAEWKGEYEATENVIAVYMSMLGGELWSKSDKLAREMYRDSDDLIGDQSLDSDPYDKDEVVI